MVDHGPVGGGALVEHELRQRALEVADLLRDVGGALGGVLEDLDLLVGGVVRLELDLARACVVHGRELGPHLEAVRHTGAGPTVAALGELGVAVRAEAVARAPPTPLEAPLGVAQTGPAVGDVCRGGLVERPDSAGPRPHVEARGFQRCARLVAAQVPKERSDSETERVARAEVLVGHGGLEDRGRAGVVLRTKLERPPTVLVGHTMDHFGSAAGASARGAQLDLWGRSVARGRVDLTLAHAAADVWDGGLDEGWVGEVERAGASLGRVLVELVDHTGQAAAPEAATEVAHGGGVALRDLGTDEVEMVAEVLRGTDRTLLGLAARASDREVDTRVAPPRLQIGGRSARDRRIIDRCIKLGYVGTKAHLGNSVARVVGGRIGARPERPLAEGVAAVRAAHAGVGKGERVEKVAVVHVGVGCAPGEAKVQVLRFLVLTNGVHLRGHGRLVRLGPLVEGSSEEVGVVVHDGRERPGVEAEGVVGLIRVVVQEGNLQFLLFVTRQGLAEHSKADLVLQGCGRVLGLKDGRSLSHVLQCVGRLGGQREGARLFRNRERAGLHSRGRAARPEREVLGDGESSRVVRGFKKLGDGVAGVGVARTKRARGVGGPSEGRAMGPLGGGEVVHSVVVVELGHKLEAICLAGDLDLAQGVTICLLNGGRATGKVRGDDPEVTGAATLVDEVRAAGGGVCLRAQVAAKFGICRWGGGDSASKTPPTPAHEPLPPGAGRGNCHAQHGIGGAERVDRLLGERSQEGGKPNGLAMVSHGASVATPSRGRSTDLCRSVVVHRERCGRCNPDGAVRSSRHQSPVGIVGVHTCDLDRVAGN
mmetsp:Transcript_58087/g.136929  ORF Transcript_58087/g.136929 Transcript_58087/m.136929 type:complete len:822 (-) Transcript_58087:385-2850(-)